MEPGLQPPSRLPRIAWADLSCSSSGSGVLIQLPAPPSQPNVSTLAPNRQTRWSSIRSMAKTNLTPKSQEKTYACPSMVCSIPNSSTDNGCPAYGLLRASPTPLLSSINVLEFQPMLCNGKPRGPIHASNSHQPRPVVAGIPTSPLRSIHLARHRSNQHLVAAQKVPRWPYTITNRLRQHVRGLSSHQNKSRFLAHQSPNQ